MTAIYTLRRGGAYSRFLMMIEAFLERRCEVHCLSLTPIQIENSFYHNHIVYFPFKKKDGLVAKLTVLSIFPLWAIWVGWRNRVDLIIAFGSLYAFVQGFAKWFLKRPMVTLIRGNSSFSLQMRNSLRCAVYLNKGIENIGLHFSDRVITNNTAIRQEILEGLGRRNNIEVQVLFNDIPTVNIPEPKDVSQTRGRYGIPEEAKVLVTAGILNRGKNIETLIEGLSKTRIRDVYLLIVGEGSTEADSRYKNSLQKLAKQFDVDKQVIFTGWLEKDDVWKVYLASDLFVLPSLSEGMPNALLEALGLNLPCLGSKIPGVADILGYAELLFDPYDDEAIAEKVKQFFSNGRVRTRIMELCRERRKAFDFDWRKRTFEMVTEGIMHKGEACPPR